MSGESSRPRMPNGPADIGLGAIDRLDRRLQTLAAAMGQPSARTPDVVVLDDLPAWEDDHSDDDILDPKQDLWLSTADGRFNSPIIPLRVGQAPKLETFYVHKDVLTRVEYFKKALCGDFRESEAQAIDLPEEDPALFHFLVAYLYEGRYVPVKPVAQALTKDADKGKGKEVGAASDPASSDSPESAGSAATVLGVLERRQRERRRWREQQREMFRGPYLKRLGRHRADCNCMSCLAATAPQCWSCSGPHSQPGSRPQHHHAGPHPHDDPRRPPNHAGGRDRDGMPPAPPLPHAPHPPPPMNRAQAILQRHREATIARIRRRQAAAAATTAAATTATAAAAVAGPGPRPAAAAMTTTTTTTTTAPAAQPAVIGSSGEDEAKREAKHIARGDMRTWLQAAELHVDAYVLAHKFLMGDGMGRAVARVLVDALEAAGPDAAVPGILALCGRLHAGVPERDPLLRMVLARVGFLQPLLWRQSSAETGGFFAAHPEMAALMLRETAARRQEEVEVEGGGTQLPGMERPWFRLG